MLLALATGPGAHAQTVAPANAFTVTAEGDGLNIDVIYPGELPVVNSVSASPWGSSAALDSLGTSSAAAGGPYSPFVYSLPGTVDGLGAGTLPSLPTAPGEVSSSYPTSPSATESTGPYSISAVSGPSDSKGSITAGNLVTGGPSAPVFSTSETSAAENGTVTATSTDGVDALNIAGVLDIGNVSSAATITQTPGGKPSYRGSTNLGTVTLTGTTLGLTGTGIKIGGSTLTEPLTPALLPVINTALSPVGITLTYLPIIYSYTDGTTSTSGSPNTSKTLEGVDSGGVSVTFTHAIPGQGQPTVILTLARVYLTALNTALPTAPITGTQPTSTTGATGSGNGTNGASGASSSSGSTPATSGIVPASSTGSGSSLADTTSPSIAPSGGSGLSGAGTTHATGSAPAVTTGLPASEVLSHRAELFYLILVVGALAALTGSQLLRFLAVRLSFASSRRRPPA